MTSTNLELENANYALSKGQIPSQDSHYYKKDEIAMGQQIKEMQDENFKLQEAIKKYGGDFKDLLKEIDKLKKDIKERDKQMQVME